MKKIMVDSKCDLEIALAWAVSARNALTNYLGFAPNQLVFGNNPGLPNVYENKPPALEPVSSSDIVRNDLNALHSARQEFIKAESNEQLARALKHNIQSNDTEDLQNGVEVYHKRNDSNEWHGPGIIIGRDGKQFFIRYGGGYVRAHECRLTCAPDSGSDDMKYVHEELNDDKTLTCKDTCEEESENRDVREGTVEANVGEGSETTTEIASSQPSILVAGNRIQGTRSDTGELVSGIVISRAGKAGGWYKDCYNFKWDSDGSISWTDLEKDFSNWKIVDDDAELLVLFNSEEVLRAKENEVTNWKDNSVYEEVEDIGQRALSVRWVVTEKVKEGQPVVKPHLIAKGFEEETGKLRRDFPTCSKEAVHLALAVAATCGGCATLWMSRQRIYKATRLIEKFIYGLPLNSIMECCGS